MPRYEWNKDKAKNNFKKHGVTFSETCEVFDDPQAFYIKDPTKTKEERTWIIGFTNQKQKCLLVVFCDRSDEEDQIKRLKRGDRSIGTRELSC